MVCGRQLVKRIVRNMDCLVDIAGGADHFYFGREQDTADHLTRHPDEKERSPPPGNLPELTQPSVSPAYRSCQVGRTVTSFMATPSGRVRAK